MEPFVVRLGRFFVSIGGLLFLLFLISDYQGVPRWSWFCLAWFLMLFGVALWWPNRGKRIPLEPAEGGVELPEPPVQASPPSQSKRGRKPRRKKSRKKR